MRFHCNPERPAVDCPTPLGHHRWEFPVLPGDDEEELVKEPAVRRLLARQGVTEEHVEMLRAVVYSHHVRLAARWRTGRVFLAGDAAHVMPPWIGQGMASGVRDVNNLCWKLDAVIRGRLPESVLDTYEAERMPHVRKLTTAAVSVGRIITERNRAVTRVRDPLLRGVMRTPRLGHFVRAASWLPQTSCATGLMVPRGRRDKVVGRRLVQPHVLGPDGERRPLDDVLGHDWAVLHTGNVASLDAWRRAGVPCLDVSPPGALPSRDTVVDVEAVLRGWMRERGVRAVAVRPDGIVYAAADGEALPPPPVTTAEGSCPGGTV